MILDVELTRKGANCLDDAIATLCGWHKSRYELMFSRSLDFGFDSERKEIDIGERIYADYSDEYMPLLERFHGHRFGSHMNQPVDQFVPMIQEQLSAGKPLFVSLDSYWIPWDPKYQRVHHVGHALLGVGFDTHGKALYVSDPYFEKKAFRIPFDHLEQGYRGCLTIDVPNEPDRDWATIADSLCDPLELWLHKRGPSRAIAAFAEEVGKLSFIREEKPAFEMLGESPIFANLGKVLNGRNNYGSMLQYLDDIKQDGRFRPIAEELRRISFQWASVRGLAVKILLADDASMHARLTESAMKKLYELADKESLLTERLLEQFRQRSATVSVSPAEFQVAAVTDFETFGDEVAWHPDLLPHLNGKAFGNGNRNANFDLSGFYFSEAPQPAEGLVRFEGIPFKLAEAPATPYDNVSCKGQSIAMDRRQGRCLAVLGSSEMGSYLDELIVEYEDGTKVSVDFGFSDWWAFRPVNGETIVWKGRIAHQQHGLIGHEANLYLSRLPLASGKPILRIVLPVQPNLHLFALTLL